MAVCICWKRAETNGERRLGRCRYCSEKTVWPGEVDRRQDEPGLRKHERDGRAPAGIFRIGELFTYDSALPSGANYPFHQVTDADVWSDDPRSPNYNRHVVIDPRNPPDNYSHEKCAVAISLIAG
jgi:Uncharacterized protein conserved in bacteria